MDKCPMHATRRYVCDWQHRENAQQRQQRVGLTTLSKTGIVVSTSK